MYYNIIRSKCHYYFAKNRQITQRSFKKDIDGRKHNIFLIFDKLSPGSIDGGRDIVVYF